jgi:hypothetical protein
LEEKREFEKELTFTASSRICRAKNLELMLLEF